MSGLSGIRELGVVVLLGDLRTLDDLALRYCVAEDASLTGAFKQGARQAVKQYSAALSRGSVAGDLPYAYQPLASVRVHPAVLAHYRRMGLYDGYQGSIRMGGVEIRERSLRQGRL